MEPVDIQETEGSSITQKRTSARTFTLKVASKIKQSSSLLCKINDSSKKKHQWINLMQPN